MGLVWELLAPGQWAPKLWHFKILASLKVFLISCFPDSVMFSSLTCNIMSEMNNCLRAMIQTGTDFGDGY